MTAGEVVCDHKPDMASVSITVDEFDVFVDVNCAKCGKSGCFGKFERTDPVDW